MAFGSEEAFSDLSESISNAAEDQSQTRVSWEGLGSRSDVTCGLVAQWSFIEHPLYSRHWLATLGVVTALGS